MSELLVLLAVFLGLGVLLAMVVGHWLRRVQERYDR
jgi:hypothetical protein